MRKNYDSEFCGSLPLQYINQLQPYGYLLVVDRNNYTIIQVSENVEKLFNVPIEDWLDQPLQNFIEEKQLAVIRQKADSGIKDKIPGKLTIKVRDQAVDFLSVIQSRDLYLVIELEKNNTDGSFLNIYQEAKYMMSAVDAAENLADLCHTAITELKKISGFDHIMIYQFDEDWNGIVTAEVIEEGMESYMGLRFPASDIPKQARELYYKNPYRLIPEREYKPVRILPIINPLTDAFTDLSNCNLRSVAAVHLEYLKNMGVMASMSTRILKDGKLWGLIAAHHRTAKFLNYEECSAFELLSNFISTKLSSIDVITEMKRQSSLQDQYSQLLTQIYLQHDLIEGLSTGESSVLDVLNCSGAAILYKGQVKLVGKTPAKYEVKVLSYWLQNLDHEGVYSYASLVEINPDAAEYKDTASGIIVLPVRKEKLEFIIGFRPEVVRQVSWGGNPNEAINFEPDKIKYHPRSSFSQWQQTVEQTCLPWNKQELAIAEKLRNFIIEYTLKMIPH